MDDSGQLAAGLRGVLGPVLGLGVEAEGLRRLSGGASRETWSFAAVAGDGRRRELILQRSRPGGSLMGPSMATEDALLAAAGAAGVPVPPVVAGVDACAALGEARVTAHVPGEALGPRLVRAERSPAGRRHLAHQLGRALAAVHAVDPDVVPGLDLVEDPLARLRDGLDLVGEARPAFELGLRRLAASRPEPLAPTVVHGDFRVGNLLVVGDDLTAVLDWELAHRGDPREDLGWLCVRAWRFGGPHEVGGLADLDDLLAGYRAAGGAPVTPDEVRWWAAVGTLTWGLICAVQARRHLDGHVRSVELATIGRRVVENEYDLLALVAPEAVPPGGLGNEPEPPVAAAFGRPTAAELVDAVAGHLDDVRGALDGAPAFQTRVATNALAIVARELRDGPAHAAAHRRRLAALGVSGDDALAAGLRDGSIDDGPDVVAALRAGVVDRLRIDNPRWLLPDDAQPAKSQEPPSR